MRPPFLVAALVVGLTGVTEGQTVPDDSQAAQVVQAFRRTPQLRIDPFRHMLVPRWGVVVSGGAIAANNALNVSDIGALIELSDNDAFLISDLLNTAGLVPAGNAAIGDGQGEGGVYVGGPFGRSLSLGLTLQGRGYGSFRMDEDAVAMLRDGNASQQSFDVGETWGTGLATAEVGAHAVVRLGPVGSQDGARVSIGFGGRYIEPIAYAQEVTVLRDGTPLYVGADSVGAALDLDVEHTPDPSLGSGSGFAGDFLARVEWPTSGLYFEVLAANLGKVTVEGVERRLLSLSLGSTDLGEIGDSLDTAEFAVQDTSEVKLSLPRTLRLSAGAWANSYLQLDASLSIPAGGDLDLPLAADLWSTWRLAPILPVRLGLALGGTYGIGYTAGIGVETRTVYVQALGGSFGGLFRGAKGFAGRFEFGVYF
jgi:hypothetical protein